MWIYHRLQYGLYSNYIAFPRFSFIMHSIWDISVNRNDNSTAFCKINCISFIDKKCWPPNSNVKPYKNRELQKTPLQGLHCFYYFYFFRGIAVHSCWKACEEVKSLSRKISWEVTHQKVRRTSDYIHFSFFPPPTTTPPPSF